jgi:glutathione S-transferase
MKRFTLYGSPHSLPTYKVALMLSMSGEPFSFRYVSFQRGMHKAPEFLALSRWGQVPVLLDGDRVHVQSLAIVEHLAETLGRFQGQDALSTLDSHLVHDNYLCAAEPTVADVFCYADVAFAEVCTFDLNRWTNVNRWAHRVTALKGFKAPFELLAMENAEVL